jgi:hypothetical protein
VKELRSIVNACFLFLVFLFVYALVKPGHAVSSAHAPRFLRMQVEDTSGRRPERVSLSVPFGLVGGALRFASLGKIRRELDLHFDEAVGSEDLHRIWEELKTKPEGTDVVHEADGATLRFRRDGETIVVEASKMSGHDPGETVNLRVPRRLVEALVTNEKDLDMDALLAEIRQGHRGDLVDVRARDGHVRIWIE